MRSRKVPSSLFRVSCIVTMTTRVLNCYYSNFDLALGQWNDQLRTGISFYSRACHLQRLLVQIVEDIEWFVRVGEQERSRAVH